MRDYHINVFYSEEDEGYIADIPDLENCSAFGSSPEEALKEKGQGPKQKAPRKDVDTGQVWSCPICGKRHSLVHVETENKVKHALRKPSS